MDPHPVVVNGSSGSWTIRQGVEVAITILGEYYVGRGVVIRVTSTDPLLVLVSVREKLPREPGAGSGERGAGIFYFNV
jgi:hypothetical protein